MDKLRNYFDIIQQPTFVRQIEIDAVVVASKKCFCLKVCSMSLQSTHYVDQTRCPPEKACFLGNRSRVGAVKMEIALDLDCCFGPQYLHEQDTAGTRSRNDARR